MKQVVNHLLKTTSSTNLHNLVLEALYTMLLIKFKDDIIKAMNKEEITIATLLDFSRAFDTIDCAILILKLYSMNFSKCFFYWLVDYLSHQQQYVQIDDKRSKSFMLI